MIALVLLCAITGASSASLRAAGKPCNTTEETGLPPWANEKKTTTLVPPNPCAGTWYRNTKVTSLCWNSDNTFPPSDNWFIEFYDPKCFCSEQFKPTWIEFAGKAMNVGAFDCSAQPHVCNHYGIVGFPTLKGYFHDTWLPGPMGAAKMDEVVKWAEQIKRGQFKDVQGAYSLVDVSAGNSTNCFCRQ